MLYGSLMQWNPVNMDTKACTHKSALVNGVSILSGLSQLTLQTHFINTESKGYNLKATE